MKITFKKSGLVNSSNTGSVAVELGERKLIISDAEFVLNIKEGSKQFFFEGELYYSVKDDKYTQIRKTDYSEFLKKKLQNFDAVEFINSIEGIYNCVYVDSEKNKAVIFCDYLNQKNFFYTESDNDFSASTSLDTIIPELKKIEYNQEALLSYLTLGYTPVYQTFYTGVNRFNTNEFIEINNDIIEHKVFPEQYTIADYDDSYLKKYDELINNSVTSRASSQNVVLNSGGWDSTSIIYLLLKSYSCDKINSLVYETKLSDGTVFNSYQSDKVKRISEFYKIKSEICEVSFDDKNLLTDWNKAKDGMKKYHTYFFIDMPKIINQAAGRNEKDLSIFSGEASDSIHNFGFSQFVSVNYSNKNLREYADKMKSYLYGPTFFSKIKNNSYTEDKVFQFFKYYFGEENFVDIAQKDVKTMVSYLKSFMLSSQRVPFSKTMHKKFVRENFSKESEENTAQKVFTPIASEISEKNLYYSLLQLYRTFHFHSPQIEVKHISLRKSGANCKIPFLDSSLVKFMYSMPENWGRGLKLRPTKYPLRTLAKEKWNVPVHILEEDGPHSYISENDAKWNYSGGEWDIYCEMAYKSVFTDYFKSVFSEIDIEKYFDTACFDTTQMKDIINKFIEGKEDTAQAAFIYKLGLLLSAGLYE